MYASADSGRELVSHCPRFFSLSCRSRSRLSRAPVANSAEPFIVVGLPLTFDRSDHILASCKLIGGSGAVVELNAGSMWARPNRSILWIFLLAFLLRAAPNIWLEWKEPGWHASNINEIEFYYDDVARSLILGEGLPLGQSTTLLRRTTLVPGHLFILSRRYMRGCWAWSILYLGRTCSLRSWCNAS